MLAGFLCRNKIGTTSSLAEDNSKACGTSVSRKVSAVAPSTSSMALHETSANDKYTLQVQQEKINQYSPDVLKEKPGLLQGCSALDKNLGDATNTTNTVDPITADVCSAHSLKKLPEINTLAHTSNEQSKKHVNFSTNPNY